MNHRRFGSLLLAVLICGSVFAHSGNPRYHVIIDTDGAIDDMRAISMLLSGNDIRVLAITCSGGTLEPGQVFNKVSELLAVFHHEGIPVGIGENLNRDLPAWSGFAASIRWGDQMDPPMVNDGCGSPEILNRVLAEYPEKVTLIALGSLKTFADWTGSDPGNAARIERIIWYNSHDLDHGFNYQVSPESYDRILQTGVPLEIVENGTGRYPVDHEYLDGLRLAGTTYSEQIIAVHSEPMVQQRIDEKHLHLWDDMVPLYLTAPILFESRTVSGVKLVSVSTQVPPDFLYDAISRLLASSVSSNNRIFTGFPVDTALYKPLFAQMAHETIGRFGLNEWKVICLTNEIHGHTGIYSIIGAKMGMRALEFFNVGVNNLEVITYAGKTPPLSCLNDGIQVSTGATIGQGLITVSDTITATPSAIFTFNGRKLRMALKQEISDSMKEEIAFGVRTYGLQSDRYWLYIEELAVRYWADFDRHEIFVME